MGKLTFLIFTQDGLSRLGIKGHMQDHIRGLYVFSRTVWPVYNHYGIITLHPYLACSRLLDSGEDGKEKGSQKVEGAGKRKKYRAFTIQRSPYNTHKNNEKRIIERQ